jgi:hypothetical protein
MKKILFSFLILAMAVPMLVADTARGEGSCAEGRIEPVISGEVVDGGVTLSWDAIEHDGLKWFKVIISKYNTHPRYGDDGYLMYIIDEEATSYMINNLTPYRNGDFGEFLTTGDEYHFAVTAVYECSDGGTKKETSSPVTLTFPGGVDNPVSDYAEPNVSVTSDEDGVRVSWDAINDDRLQAFKIVASNNNQNPIYGQDGYLMYIIDEDSTSHLINNAHFYKNGDIGGKFKPGEDYYFTVTAIYTYKKLTGNAESTVYNGPAQPTASLEPELIEIDNKATLLKNDKMGEIFQELNQLRNTVKEQANQIKYLGSLVSDLSGLLEEAKQALNDFITYGVDENTQQLGEGERAAVIHSYKSAFNKLPETESELSDAIRIANGRWPSMTSQSAENKGKQSFKTIYKRDADMDHPNDNAAVTVMSYGLRQKATNRNLDSERTGIQIFKDIYGHTPSNTDEWNIMQAITYSGATR